jgi:hypothetical protein
MIINIGVGVIFLITLFGIKIMMVDHPALAKQLTFLDFKIQKLDENYALIQSLLEKAIKVQQTNEEIVAVLSFMNTATFLIVEVAIILYLYRLYRNQLLFTPKGDTTPEK